METLSAVRQAGRFLIVGIANTVLTGGLFFALTFVLPVSVAYTVSFALGVVFVVVVSPQLVFSARPSTTRRAAYAAWYVLVYLVGLGCVRVLDDVARFDHLQVVILTLVCTSALSFIGGRTILTRRRSGEDS